jgi:predicted enzyme related to lactoylglutathione lyase
MTLALEAITFDCADAAALAGFWSALLEHPVDDGASADFAAIGLADGNKAHPAWMFIKVPEAKSAKNRCHPDLISEDRAAAVARAVAAGATVVGEHDESGTAWTSLVDPEGNELDIVS